MNRSAISPDILHIYHGKLNTVIEKIGMPCFIPIIVCYSWIWMQN